MAKVNEVWSTTGAPVWNKSMEAVADGWSKTVEVVGDVTERSMESVEKTKAMMGAVTADIQPASEKVCVWTRGGC